MDGTAREGGRWQVRKGEAIGVREQDTASNTVSVMRLDAWRPGRSWRRVKYSGCPFFLSCSDASRP